MFAKLKTALSAVEKEEEEREREREIGRKREKGRGTEGDQILNVKVLLFPACC